MSADRFSGRVEDVAAACEALAAAVSRGAEGLREEAAAALVAVPLTHPERWLERTGYDVVEATARTILAGEARAEGLRELAADLRAGIPAMLETGWTKTLAGCP